MRVRVKVTGGEELSKMLAKLSEKVVSSEIDKALLSVASPYVSNLKSRYEPYRTTSGKASKDGHIGDSIELFKRKKKLDGYFAYYLGPNYRKGGQLAHILEYGTVERYIANKKAGGVRMGKGRMYGATLYRGRVVPIGIIRRFQDEINRSATEQLGNEINNTIIRLANQVGVKINDN